MKRFILGLSLMIMFSISVVTYSQCFYKEMQENIIRLHILAKSNSPEDQEIKLAVRDEVLSATKNIDVKDTKNFLTIAQETANQYLKDNNIPYRAKGEMGYFHFPKKEYENITLPAGKYKGVRIVLDEGKGKNWWCVMYPPVCTATNDEALNMLKNSLSDNNYDIITQKPRVRFWLLDFLNK